LGLTDYWTFFRNARRNLISAFTGTAYEQPIIRRQLAGSETWVVSDPEAVKRVLLDNANNYAKSQQQKRRLEPALGQSLLLADGDAWRWQRRTTAPAFQHRKIVGFAPLMIAAVGDMLARWDSEGQPERDIAQEMMRLTYDVLSRTIFGRAAPLAADRMGQAIDLYLSTAGRMDVAGMLNLPLWVPTIGRIRARPALRWFREEIGGAIRRRRVELARGVNADSADLLTMLLTATDPETGQPMDDELVYDNALTFIVAGHETTSNALSWTFFLLSEYPWAEQRVHAELDAVLGGRTATADDIPRLVYLRQVLDESMRLYPPAPFAGREAIEADVLGGEPVKPGTQILISTYILHRHRLLWEEPDLFDPERFAPGKREAIHRFAYIPFAAGPRICIGMAFALQEAMLLLATILQRYRLTLRPGHVVEPHATITLRPRGGLPMRLERRA
jgi:cytochrome P450